MSFTAATRSLRPSGSVKRLGRWGYIAVRGVLPRRPKGFYRIDMAEPPDTRGFPHGDANFDGVVDDAELLLVLFFFGEQAQTTGLAPRTGVFREAQRFPTLGAGACGA